MGFIKIILLFLYIILGFIIHPLLWIIAQFKKDDDFPYYHRIRTFDAPNECCRPFVYDSFPSEEIHQKFDEKMLNAFKIIGHLEDYQIKPTVQFLGFEYHKGNEHPATGMILQCKTCRKLWEYNWPDQAYRGYCKPINLTFDEIAYFLNEKGL
jgi:hypothetical protein